MLTASQLPPLEAVVARLSNEIVLLAEPLVLALDDYHAIHGEAVPEFLNALVLHWPQPLRLVLITRRRSVTAGGAPARQGAAYRGARLTTYASPGRRSQRTRPGAAGATQRVRRGLLQ